MITHSCGVMRAKRALTYVNEKRFYIDPKRPATLSRFILWGDKTNLKDSVKDYNRRFDL